MCKVIKRRFSPNRLFLAVSKSYVPAGGWTNADLQTPNGASLNRDLIIIHKAAVARGIRSYSPWLRDRFTKLVEAIIAEVITAKRNLGQVRARSVAGAKEVFTVNVTGDETLWARAIERELSKFTTELSVDVIPRMQSVAAETFGKVSTVLGRRTADGDGNLVLSRVRRIGTQVTNISETTRRRISAIIAAGLDEGQPVNEVARRLREALPQIAYNRIATITRTEMGRSADLGKILAMQQSSTIDKVKVVGCQAREANSPQWRGQSTCNVVHVPVAEAHLLEFHINHTGTWIVESFKDPARIPMGPVLPPAALPPPGTPPPGLPPASEVRPPTLPIPAPSLPPPNLPPAGLPTAILPASTIELLPEFRPVIAPPPAAVVAQTAEQKLINVLKYGQQQHAEDYHELMEARQRAYRAFQATQNATSAAEAVQLSKLVQIAEAEEKKLREAYEEKLLRLIEVPIDRQHTSPDTMLQYVDKAPTPVGFGNVKKITDLTRTRMERKLGKAMRKVTRVMDKELVPPTGPWTAIDMTRAYHWDGRLYLSEGSNISTMVHEYLHYVEKWRPDMAQASADFMEQRRLVGKDGKKEEPKLLSLLTGNNGYRPEEAAYEDSWVTNGGTHYTGRVNLLRPDLVGKEIITTGIERLLKDPVEFAKNDPSFMLHVLKVLNKEF